MRPDLNNSRLVGKIVSFLAKYEAEHSDSSEIEYVDLREFGFTEDGEGDLDFNLRKAQALVGPKWSRVPKNQSCTIIYDPRF
jgi:hypothetical protein